MSIFWQEDGLVWYVRFTANKYTNLLFTVDSAGDHFRPTKTKSNELNKLGWLIIKADYLEEGVVSIYWQEEDGLVSMYVIRPIGNWVSMYVIRPICN